MTNFAQALSAAVADDPERPAVKLDELVLNYGLLDQAAARAAGFLRSKGVQEGDRVGMQLPNVPYFPVVYFGALRLGAVVVPMNPLLKEREVAYHLSDSGARVLVGWHQFADPCRAGAAEAGAECVLAEPGEFEQLLFGAEPVEQVAERADEDPAVIIYTSGTTGTPKGATLTHANIRAAAQTGRDLVDAGPHTVSVATLPLFHVFGMSAIMNVTVCGHGLLTLVPRFEPGKVLEVIERDSATTFGGVPTMFSALLHHPDRERRPSSLDLCVSGGAPMPVEVLRGFDEAFGAKVLEGYGLSETCGMGTFNRPDRERKPGSIGVPIGGTEIRLVDDDGNDVPRGEPGELVMRGPFVMAGYWNRPDATEEVMRGGWFHTGDVATVDEDGYYFIVDRKKDLIIRGGYNVYPREVEEVLYAHPAVREAAVIGVPHESLGEEVGAAVALKDDASEVEVDELREYVKQRVAAYKYPRVVWIVDELPKGPTGKILKREIEVPDSVVKS